MTDLEELLSRLESLLESLATTDADQSAVTYELLDGVDALHRLALSRLGDALGADLVADLRASDPAVSWLFDAYAVGVDEAAEVEAALSSARPYIESHGGSVELVEVSGGAVRLHMGGTCAGCSASAQTLRDKIEVALREGFAGFDHLDVDIDDAPSHPPPNITPVELGPRR